MAKSLCTCGETLRWKADEPESDESLLAAKRDLPNDLNEFWEDRVDLARTAALCPRCGRLWIAWSDREEPTEYVPTRAALDEHLMRAVLYAALFFETSNEEDCDLDLSVKQLEGMAAELRKLTPAQQEEFRRFAYDEAEREPVPQFANEIRALINGLMPEDTAE